jgi:hypothetical protein
MPSCPFTIAAAAVAARSLGYSQAAELIATDKLSPERIVRLFSASASKSAKRDAAFVVLAGGIARYGDNPQNWSSEPETSLAHALIRAEFARTADEAAHFVADHWVEIERLAIACGAGAAA